MNHFRTILVEVDASASVHPALTWATSLARRSNARIRLVHVMSAVNTSRVPDNDDRHGELVRIRRQQLVRVASKSPDVVDSVAVLQGHHADALAREANERALDLVVIHQHRDLTTGPGEVQPDVDLFQRCPCPVIAVRSGALPAQPTIAVAVDVDPCDPATQVGAATLVGTGFNIANRMGGSLSLVHAWEPPGSARGIAAQPSVNTDDVAAHRRDVVRVLAGLADTADGHRLTRRLTVKHGPVDEVLPSFVVEEAIDLLVIGTSTHHHGYPQMSRTDRLFARLPCSVMTVQMTAVVAT